MREQAIFWAALIVLAAVQSANAQFGVRWQREAREFGWLTDYETAKQQAKESGKPIMLVFRCVP